MSRSYRSRIIRILHNTLKGMKTISYTLLALAINSFAYSQNLVPNGDFEIFDPCPVTQGHIEYAQPWTNPAQATPDYFNVCAAGTNGGVPINNRGYQMPFSGDGYAGFLLSSKQSQINVREYISVELIEPLVSGETYELQFHLNLANSSNHALSTMGAYFSSSSSFPLNGQLIDVIPQIVNETGPLIDTLNWIPISAEYIASGGETFLTIGNFAHDDDSEIEEVNGTYDWSFYYIDDVSLTNIISSNLESTLPSVNIYPNPFTNNFNITVSKDNHYHLDLFDITGRKILATKFLGDTSVNTHKLSDGIYFYELSSSKGILEKGKMLKK